MGRLTNLLAGIGLGAAGMYFFDPRLGRTRRARLRDQWTHLSTQVPEQARGKMRDLQNRAQGAMHEVQKQLDRQGGQEEQTSPSQEESQAQHLQSLGRGEGKEMHTPTGRDGQMAATSSQGSSRTGASSQGKQGSGPGEGGSPAPSRQPTPKQQMNL